MKIRITLNNENKIYECIKNNHIYNYKDEDVLVAIDVVNNVIVRKSIDYEVCLKFKIDEVTNNNCLYNNNEFVLEVKTYEIDTEPYYIKYEILGGETIELKLEEIDD